MSDDVLVYLLLFCSTGVAHALLFAPLLWKRLRFVSLPKSWSWMFCWRNIDRAVSEEVTARLCQTVHTGSHFFGGFCCLYTLMSIATPNRYNASQYLVMTVGGISAVLLRLCRTQMLRRLLPAIYAWSMLCLCGLIYTTDAGNEYIVLRALSWANIVRVLVSVAFGQVGMTCVLNSAIAIANTFFVQSMLDRLGPGSDFTDGPLSVFSFEIMQMVCIVACTWHRRVSLENECSQTLMNKSLSVESSAMTSLLGLVCDVVVELDGDLQVVEHSPSLSAMLMINRNTTGMYLANYMPSDSDRDMFDQRLRGRVDLDTSGCEPAALHVNLRDSIGNNIPVEIFYVTFKSAKGRHNCFAGIREVGDQPVARLPPSNLCSRVKKALSAAEEGRLPKLGTTPIGAPRPIGFKCAHSESAGSSCHSMVSSASKTNALDARFELTSTDAKKLSILQMVMQWNVPMIQGSCCPLHTELKELISLTKLVFKTPCFKAFRLVGNSQCEACGLILSTDDGGTSKEHCRGAKVRMVSVRDRRASRSSTSSEGPLALHVEL